MLNVIIPIVKALVVDDVAKRAIKAIEKTEKTLKDTQVDYETKKKIIDNAVEKSKNKPFWMSNKVRVSAVGFLVPVLNHYFGWGLQEDLVLKFLGVCLAIAGFQAAADFGKNK